MIKFNYVLLLGGNIGDTRQTINSVHSKIEELVGNIVNASSLYTSEPWGFEAQQWFVNQALELESALTAEQVLQTTQQIEMDLGRIRIANSTRFHSRPIDIDILFCDNHIINTPYLQLPHPMLHLRRFTLLPLAELMPNFIHPLLNLSIAELLDRCPDKGNVKKM
ncbi:MAG: 2-amino-4-hydroxy-6-hydroxymethyldihydropteridine diphosphokinase [Bacteroidales bacterium]